VEEGDFVYPIFSESKLFSLGDKNFEVILEVDEEYAGLIRLGNKAFVTFDSLPDKVFQGEVFQIINEIDRTKRSFIVKVRLQEIPYLPAQATCEANLVIEEKIALVIPEKALLKDSTVFVKGKGKVKVSVGERFGEYVEVLSGLRKGEEVKILE
jgi:HlyD family secretion protein